MASPSSSRKLMPPPPIPPGRGISTASSATDTGSNSSSESDSDSDTVTATHSHTSSPSSSRVPNTASSLGSKSLAAITSSFLLEDLKAAVSGYQATASYCLGGKIPISPVADIDDTTSMIPEEDMNDGDDDEDDEDEEDESTLSSKTPMSSPPITIRFDSPPTPPHTPNQSIHKITFPLPSPNQSSNKSNGLQDLLHACTPATFGHDGRDVLDESYRKVGNLDAENFSTNFHPADFGILDAIKQTLLPGLDGMGLGAGSGVRSGREEHWGVRAELYKLNVYSGPSGMFQKHVDTPRAATQFGSLVVCLPCDHEGGQLLVSHEGHVSVFDWSTSSSSSEDRNAIKWCAFYSDCEHEVLPVTTGHRITITYNLYISEHIGGILQRYPTADPSSYPLFEGAKKMLEMPGFMSEGGTLGFYCAHQYAHARKATNQLMPYALKGIDAVLFAVFASLGVKVHVRPVLDNDAWEQEVEYYSTEYKEHWDYVEGEGEEYDSWKARQVGITRYGSKFEDIMSTNDETDSLSSNIKRTWPLVEDHHVQWLNEATAAGWEPALSHLRYENDYCLSWSYSHAAIFIDIPPRRERKQVPETGTEFPDWEAMRPVDETK